LLAGRKTLMSLASFEAASRPAAVAGILSQSDYGIVRTPRRSVLDLPAQFVSMHRLI